MTGTDPPTQPMSVVARSGPTDLAAVRARLRAERRRHDDHRLSRIGHCLFCLDCRVRLGPA